MMHIVAIGFPATVKNNVCSSIVVETHLTQTSTITTKCLTLTYLIQTLYLKLSETVSAVSLTLFYSAFLSLPPSLLPLQFAHAHCTVQPQTHTQGRERQKEIEVGMALCIPIRNCWEFK